MPSLWKLPGPDRFVRSVADDLRDGSSVILRLADATPPGLATELERRCRWGFDWTPVRAESGAQPLSQLRREVSPEASATAAGSPLALALHSSFQRRLIWVAGVESTAWRRWSAFLRSYSEACRNHVGKAKRSVFIVPLWGEHLQEPLPEVALAHREFRDVAHRDDIFILALQRELNSPRGLSRERRALMAHTVAQIAQWDHALAERLLDARPMEIILQPRDLLRVYAKERGWTADTPEDWERGTIDGPRDRPVPHSALLAVAGREAELDRRLWAAQASVLMPLVEQRRADFVNRYRHHFRLPFETELGVVERPEDLELGQVVYYFERHDPPSMRAMREARWLRHFRNKLAHIEPLPPDQALHPILLG